MTDPQVAVGMLLILILAIFLGFPVAFTLMALGVGFGYYTYYDPGRMWRAYERAVEGGADSWTTFETWISGFFLLVWVYYAQSELYLIDPAVMALSPVAAGAIGIAALAGGWLFYDLLCKSPLSKNDVVLGLLGFGYVVAASWAFASVFSGRGALIHTGALMATIMSANVFFVIMPGQRKTIAGIPTVMGEGS